MGADMIGRLGKVGIWSMEMRYAEPAAALDVALEIEALGFGALWVPGGIEHGVLPVIAALAGGTSRIVLATGILNIWRESPEEVGEWWAGLPETSRDRVLLGLGVSHGPVVGKSYANSKPLTVMRDYLDGLAKAGVPADNLCLAALAPKMLELSRDRTLGTHPYLAPPEHTVISRAAVGPGKLVAPELGVILETDPAKARAIGRNALGGYDQLPNYLNNWRRSGFSEDDITQRSDRLIDGLFAWGEPAKIAQRVREHHDAGADHVCIQVIRGSMNVDLENAGDDPLAGLRSVGKGIEKLRVEARQLAEALL